MSHGLSAFYRTEQHSALTKWGIRNLLVEDACAAGNPKHHESVIRVTQFGNGLFGTTVRAADIVSALE